MINNTNSEILFLFFPITESTSWSQRKLKSPEQIKLYQIVFELSLLS